MFGTVSVAGSSIPLGHEIVSVAQNASHAAPASLHERIARNPYRQDNSLNTYNVFVLVSALIASKKSRTRARLVR